MTTTTEPHRRKVQIALSVDFDAVSGWLGTGGSTKNTLSDFSAGVFAGNVGVPRLLNLFKKIRIANNVTWFIPGHSMETFPDQTKAIVESGCEIGIHGYAHEGATQVSGEQQRDILVKCISLAKGLTGKAPKGYRAPLYQINDSVLDLLEEHSFLYDSSLSHHDSKAYHVPIQTAFSLPDFSKQASSWMHPISEISAPKTRELVEIPANWYMEDMTPLQFWPHTENSQGYVDVRVIETMWKDRFEWLWRNGFDGAGPSDFIFPLIIHPDTSGMAHIIGMLERFLGWLLAFGDEVQFCTYEKIARDFLERQEVVAADI